MNPVLNLSESFEHNIVLDPASRVTCNLYASLEIVSDCKKEIEFIMPVIENCMPELWQQLTLNIKSNSWVHQIEKSSNQAFSFSLVFISDKEICSLNRSYRNKHTPTDVLTFTLCDESVAKENLLHLPEVDLGEIYISLEWAKNKVCKKLAESNEQKLNFFHVLTLFILERIVHGCLHLAGVHHKTMPAYNKVVRIQRKVIEAIVKKIDKTLTN